MPSSPGQSRPTDSHDNKGIGPCDVPIRDCGTGSIPGGVQPWGLFPSGIVKVDPPPSPAPGPLIFCGYADGAPICGSGSRTTAVELLGSNPPYQGYGWFQGSRPELVISGDPSAPDRVRVVLSASSVVDFTLVSGSSPNTFAGVNGAQGVVVREAGSTSTPELYRYYDTDGVVWTFFGYYTGSSSDWVDTYGAKGQLWTAANADGTSAGAVHYTGDATDPVNALATGFIQDSSSHPTAQAAVVYDGAGRKQVYSYDTTIGTTDMLTSIEMFVDRDLSEETDWQLVWSVEFTYYNATVPGHGVAGDLKYVTETRPLTSGGSDVRTTYFRYYTDTVTYDMRHLIKFKVEPEGVRRAGLSNLDSLSDTSLKNYSEYYYIYDTAGRVTNLETAGGCNCGGSFEFTRSTNGSYNPSLAYDSSGTQGTGDWSSSRWHSRTVVKFPNEAQEALYYDEMGWLLARVYSDAANATSPFDPDPLLSPKNTIWITKYERDGRGRPVREYTPEAVESSAYDHSNGTVVVRNAAGLVRVTEYYVPPGSADNYLGLAVAKRLVQEGAGGGSAAVVLEEFSYLNPTGSSPQGIHDFGSTNPVRLAKQLLATHKTYRGASIVDETTFSYEFYPSSWRIKKSTKTLPALASGDGSGPAVVAQQECLDERGRRVFTVGRDGLIEYSQYGIDGQLVTSIRDPSSTDTPLSTLATGFGLTLSNPGLHYKTQYQYDDQGRLASLTLPNGRVAGNHFTKLADDRLVTLAVTKQSGAGPITYEGPVSYKVRNLANNVEAEAIIGLPGGLSTASMSTWVDTSASDVIGAVQVGAIAKLVVNVYDDHGSRLDAVRRFTVIPSSYASATSSQYEQCTYGYDPGGEVRRVKDQTGTITYSVLDKLNRTTERWIGTDDTGFAGGDTGGTNNMTKATTIVYDNGGVGNSLPTTRTAHVNGSSGSDRAISMAYDYRGRRVVQVNPLPPHSVFKYDDFDHVVAAGMYSTSPGVVDPVSTSSGRVGLIEYVYNTRGMVSKESRHKIDQADGSDDDVITTSRWYNGSGQVVKTKSDQLTKSLYDVLGRETHKFIVAKDDDDDSYTDAATVVGDAVTSEQQHLYDDLNRTGLLLMNVLIERDVNDLSTVDELDAVGDSLDVVAVSHSSFNGRPQITSYFYDSLDRPIASVVLGDNGSATYTRSSDSTPGTRSSTRLIASRTYNPDGTVATTTDPKGLVLSMEYDAVGRTTKEIMNYVNGAPGGGSLGDNDCVKEFVYLNGQLRQLKSKMPSSTDDQVTTYTYGVLQTGSLPSDITSNRLLANIEYPGSTDIVQFSYNRLGQQIGVIDQAGNEIGTSYDLLGRETALSVADVATGFDDTVRRVEKTYLPRGELSTVTQFDAVTSGNALDQVRFTYDGWGSLERIRQDVDGAMNSSGQSTSGRDAFDVQYAYAKSTPASGAQVVRRTSMQIGTESTVYEQVGFSYGASGSINDSMSRVASVSTGSVSPVTIASYSYLGSSSVVGVIFDEPGLDSSVFSSSGGGVTYDGLDQFNRVTRSRWSRGSGSPFYDVTIGYDQNSNPDSVVDNVHVKLGSGKHLFDVVYTLDDLNRVVGADEGHKNGAAIQSGYRTRNELWNNLSLSGNWGSRQLDVDGDGSYLGEMDRNESLSDNVFTKANEWTNRKVLKSGADRDQCTYGYDSTGNLTAETITMYRTTGLGTLVSLSQRVFVYDVFGRLVKVTGGLPVEEGPEVVIARFRYNGLGYRIMVQEDHDLNGSLSNSERYYAAFDEQWRQVATFRDQDEAPKETFVFHGAQRTPGNNRFALEGPILRDRDNSSCGSGCVPWTAASDGNLEERRFYCQNWRTDVVAITESSGVPVEYVRYSSFGEAVVYPIADLDMNGVVDNSDYLEWFNVLAGRTDGPSVFSSDLNFDGDAGQDADTEAFMASYADNMGYAGAGRMSSPAVGNRIGYASYEWTPSLRAYDVRNRVYFPELGRWNRRDPLGYVAGQVSLYEYVGNAPIFWTDPMGLQAKRSPSDHGDFPIPSRDELPPLPSPPSGCFEVRVSLPENLKRIDICSALKTAKAAGWDIEEFVRQYSPTGGLDANKFRNMIIKDPDGNDVDMDWLMTILYYYYHTNVKYFAWVLAWDNESALIYQYGKWVWMHINSWRTGRAEELSYDRMWQPDEYLAAEYAQQIINGDLTIEELLSRYNCDSPAVAPQPTTGGGGYSGGGGATGEW